MNRISKLVRIISFGGLAVLLLVSLAACMGDGDDGSEIETPAASTSTPVASPPSSSQSSATPVPPGPAPEPAEFNVSDVQMIDEWRSIQIPEFPGSERVGFTPEGSAAIPNAGYFVFRSDADPEEIIAFYRAALQFYGWNEQRADSKQILADNGNSTLQVLAERRESATSIMLTLLDK